MNDREQREELRRFLKDRRGRLNPSDVGLPSVGRRRVRGLRREEVASLAGIGVSWYTALESGDADGVSEATVRAVADALRLSESERNYLLTLAGRSDVPSELYEPGELLRATLKAIRFPAYIITATWDVLDCNEAFRRIWGVEASEIPFNAVERLFVHPQARKMHGPHFVENIAPVVAMLRSAIGRRPHLTTLQRVRAQLLAEAELRELWDAYEISDPLVPNTCTIQSPLGTFRYEALTLTDPAGKTSGLVVQVPDPSSLALLTRDPPQAEIAKRSPPPPEREPDSN
jgi:transcriptional regulator with XRE-family HTH domain